MIADSVISLLAVWQVLNDTASADISTVLSFIWGLVAERDEYVGGRAGGPRAEEVNLKKRRGFAVMVPMAPSLETRSEI